MIEFRVRLRSTEHSFHEITVKAENADEAQEKAMRTPIEDEDWEYQDSYRCVQSIDEV